MPRGYLVRVARGAAPPPTNDSRDVEPLPAGVDMMADARMARVPLGANGILLGTLFHKADSSRVTAVPEHRDDWAANLLDRHWGGYVAFWRDAHAHRVLRDPSGAIPCYYVERPDMILLGSDLDALRLGGWVARPDLEVVARQFLDGQLQRETTCIPGVRELLPGMMLEITDKGCRSERPWRSERFVFDASNVSAVSVVTSVSAPSGPNIMEVARTRLRGVVEECTAAWRSCFKVPLLEMSGGLDSSIVAACLGITVAGIPALNLVTPGRDGDERRYARAIAERIGACLTEGLRDPDRIDLRVAIAPHLPRPGVRGFTQESDRLITELADAVGADAIFSGGGGDSVFCALPPALAAADALQALGVGGRFFDALRDAAECSNRTVWSSLRSAVRRAPPKTESRARLTRRGLLAADFHVSPGDVVHPWLEGAANLLPGRREHIAMIAGILGHLHGMGRAQHRPMIFPLMAQPVIEACLSIPSWLWIEDGLDRAVARRAFADRLPSSVAFRRTKGHLDVFGRMVFDRHRPAIREMLLEGALAAGGLLDRVSIERCLRVNSPAHTIHHFDFLELADMEAWVQGVSSDRR